MSFHVKRSQTKDQKPMIQYNGIRTTIWATPEPGKSVREIQTTHMPTKLQEIPDELNYLTPPPHWHWYQDEYFHIKEGHVLAILSLQHNLTSSRRYIFTLEGKDTTISASDPQPQRIPAGARHTFKVDDTHEGPCTIEISTIVSPRSPKTSPEEEGANEKFFRNIYSYLDDCYVQGCSPKLPQLLLFLDSAEVSLALPGPAWIARPASWLLGVVVGRWVGGWLLGYRASYEEYWHDETKKAK